MEGVLIIDGVTVNNSGNPLNCGGRETEYAKAIEALNKARRTKSADEALMLMKNLYDNGVLFPSSLMFNVDREGCNRLPSLEAISHLPGVQEIYNSTEQYWKEMQSKKAIKSFIIRTLINLSLCTTSGKLVDLNPSVFGEIMRAWKEKDGTFIKSYVKHDWQVVAINHVARALARLNGDASYLLATKQPRSDGKNRRGFGADFVLSNPTSAQEQWVSMFNEWLHSQNLKTTKRHKAAFLMLIEWANTYPEDVSVDPRLFLSQPRTTPSLLEFLRDENGNLARENQILAKYVDRFTQWIIDGFMRDVDEDGEVSVGIGPLSYSDKLIILGSSSSPKSNEATSRPLPTAYRLKAQRILNDNDYAWPKSLTNQYFDWKNSETGADEKIWVPTLTYLFETMLEIPVRRIQVQCLDSGEGDEEVYAPKLNKWIKNPGPAAGYWERDPNAKVKKRGAIRDFSKLGRPLVGFYINTNKTADRYVVDGERTGYNIPWQNENVIRLFTNLREWQMKYNPQTQPTPFQSLGTEVFGYDATETAIKLTPDRFYLFRSPCGITNRLHPATYNQCTKFWNELMAELERVLKSEGEDVTIVEKRGDKGQPEKVAYNIHGLRVATLTAFAEAGVPIEVLSKIVAGHSSILMTIYYLKFNEVSISELLNEKAITIKGNASDELRRHLENRSWERAKNLAVYNDEECFRNVMSSSFSPLWSNEGYGICPHGGTRCEDGGPTLRKAGKANATYAPVPGGKHNCLRCRHFISGTPFALQMYLKTNHLLAQANKLSVEYDEFVNELKDLENQRYVLVREGHKDEVTGKMKARLKELEGVCDMRGETLNETLLTLHAAWRFFEGIKQIMAREEDTNSSLPALLCSSEADFEIGTRETTRFEVLTHLINASLIYPWLRDESNELESLHFMDTIRIRNCLETLTVAPLTKEQRRRALTENNTLLLKIVGAEEAQRLYEGKVTLKELGLQDTLAMAIGNPIAFLPGAATPPMIEEAVYG